MSGQSWEDVYLPEGPSHYQWTKDNCTKHTKQQIAEKLGRSLTSVAHKLKHEGWLSLDDLPVIQGAETKAIPEVEGIPIESLLKAIKDKPRSLDELSQEFDRSRDTMRYALEQLQEQAYEIIQTEKSRQYLWSTQTPNIVAPSTILWDKETLEFKLGIISDTQIGSKAAQMSALIRAVDIMYDKGVRHILHCGDLNAGRGVYSGQDLDNVTMRADEQQAMVTTYWPKREGLTYYIMGGNHDWSFLRTGGYNAVLGACKVRADFKYRGFNLATVRITPEIDALMWHPSGGVPYAMSYRSQKMAEQVAMEQLMEVLEKNATPKVRFLFCGHLHIFVQFWQGPIFVAHVGCFEGQTDYLKKKALYPHIGCMILEGHFTKEMSLIRDLTITYLRFTEIENDYLNYPVPYEEEPTLEPIFQWTGKKK